MEVNIYIEIWTLKVKCAQYRICSQAAFKNARAMFLSKLGGVGSSFRLGSKISQDGCPRLDLTPPKVCRGVFNVYHAPLIGHSHILVVGSSERANFVHCH